MELADFTKCRLNAALKAKKKCLNYKMFIKKMSMLPHNWSKYKGNLSEHKSENFADMGEGNDQTKMNDTN
jgi:hypothetical protein